MPSQLTTEFWVSALIRRASVGGATAVVARKGDPTAGAVLVKLYDHITRTARLYAEALGGAEGERRWMQPHPDAPESDLDAYAERQIRYDPDLWVVEIEDREGRHFLTEPVE
ncbi:DUF1491 family protein [soil metagenome]